MLPIFFFGNPLLKEEDQNLKEPGSSKFREEMINSPVYNYREVKIFLHNLAFKSHIIIIMAQFPPNTWRGITLGGLKINYSDGFVLPVFVTTRLCNNAGSTSKAVWEIDKYTSTPSH